MGNNLKSLRVAKKWTHDEAAAAIGVSRGHFIKLERGERKLTEKTIQQAAKGFEVSVSDILTGASRVPLLGYAGAGGQAFFSEISSGDFIETDAPEGTVAVQIRGASLGHGFDGWYALYNDRRDPLTEDQYGRLCVVGTEDERTLVKWVHRAAGKGVNLMSGVGEIEPNVVILWAARVIELLPAALVN